MGYKIGSFNMCNLGNAARSSENKRNLRRIAEIIRSENFDVVALQEVLSEGKAFTDNGMTKKSILMELGPNWEFAWACAEGEEQPRGEGYAFVWNKRRLRLASGYDRNGIERIFWPRICKAKTDGFCRKPYYARFTPSGVYGGPFFEIRLLCIHTYYGDDSVLARVKRQNELDILLKEIYPQIEDKRYGNNMPAYTILLGDYNVALKRPWKEELYLNDKKPMYLLADEDDIVETSKWGNKRIKTVQDQLTTLKKFDKDGEIGGQNSNRGYNFDYDHFSYDIDRFEGVDVKARRIDAVRKYCEDDFSKYREQVSDHVPILLEFELR